MLIVTLAAIALAGVSCLQLEQPVLIENLSGDEIVFGADAYVEAQTKASSGTTETTSLTSFYVSAVTGSAGSESSAFGSTQFAQVTGSSPAAYKGSKLWPASNQNYKFYASNCPLTFAAAGTTVSATNTTDVVCAYLTNGTYKTKNTLTFEHIFARFGRVDVVAESGYTISNISIRITPKTGGTYNLRTGAGKTDGTGWSSVTTGSATVVANATGANANDIYMVPGTYQITATWTATQSGTSITYTNKVVNIPIVGGKTNVVSIVLGERIFLGVDLVEYCEYDYRDNLDYLTFYCDEAGTIGWKCSNAFVAKTIQYSKNQGATWTNITSTTSGATISVSAGDVVWFKGSNSSYADVLGESYENKQYIRNYFTLTNKAHVYGNVNSLTGNNTSVDVGCFACLFEGCQSNLYTYVGKKIILPATTLASDCYAEMFAGCTSLTTAPDLPATTLADFCYFIMFSRCESLRTAPELPATTMVSNCYGNMFSGCSSLTIAPELPATTMAERCYGAMFRFCSSLKLAPELPATTLASYCYDCMFYDCTSLKLAPELPATTMASYCYDCMFYGCTSLKLAPELPATTMASYCYQNMFAGCTSLTTAPELPATTMASYCYSSMFAGCSSLTFVPELPATTLASYCYENMFKVCTSLVTAPELPAMTMASGCYRDMFSFCTSLKLAPELPATTMASSCYSSMFYGCTSLTSAPNLNATTLANSCYSSMFQECTSLTSAPALPATTLENYCYQNMFRGCTSLTTAPTLNATSLKTYCYAYMFYGCTSLTTAPVLSATTLATYCYSNMFRGCTSLTTAPDLPAKTLVSGCYNYMFYGCSSLNYIKALFTTTPSNSYTNNWVNGVAATGTFRKYSDATWNVSGVNGVPTGWNITYYSESMGREE